MIERKTEPFGVVDIFPFADGELTRDNYLTERIEIFPTGCERDGYRIRWAGQMYTRESWNHFWTAMNEGMQRAFEIDDERSGK